MIRILLAAALCVFTVAAATAQSVRMAPLSPKAGRMISDTVEAAERLFPRLPAVVLSSNFQDLCQGRGTHPLLRYCTSENKIFVSAALAEEVPDDGRASYMIAHMLAHGAQVRHGVATDALNAIRAQPAREGELRAMVTGQVECVAGVIFRAAGGSRRASLSKWFAEEPFTGPHWGRAPMTAGPAVSIGLALRDEWFQAGLKAGDLSACSVGEISADKLVRARR